MKPAFIEHLSQTSVSYAHRHPSSGISEAFRSGAAWHSRAQWHTASQAPLRGGAVLVVFKSSTGSEIVRLSVLSATTNWPLLCSLLNLVRWAYISDLMPCSEEDIHVSI